MFVILFFYEFEEGRVEKTYYKIDAKQKKYVATEKSDTR